MAGRRDFYEILGVGREASVEEIKKSYRKVAFQYHPDRNPENREAENRFKEATEAYEILSNPEKRLIYDRFGHEGLSSSGLQGFSGFEDVFSSFGDLFESFFGRSDWTRSRKRPERGEDLKYRLTVGLEDAAFGMEAQIEVPRRTECPRCSGSGLEPGYEFEVCGECDGRGRIVKEHGLMRFTVQCPACEGQGRIVSHPCEKCGGKGRGVEHKRFEFRVPPGVDSGTRLRIRGGGNAGKNGGEAGDLVVEIEVKSHACFERKGDDLIFRLGLCFSQAAVGTTVEVPTLEGHEKIRIVPGVRHGDILRLHGKGIPRLRGSGRGDQLIVLDLKIPTELTSRQEEILRELESLEQVQTCPEVGMPGMEAAAEWNSGEL